MLHDSSALKKSSLRAKIKAVSAKQTEPSSFEESMKGLCALTKSNCECKSRGFSLAAPQATIVATVCSCISSCPACLGSTILSGREGARTCRDPSPVRLVTLYNEAELPARFLEANLQNFRNFSGNGREVVMQVQSWCSSFKPIGGKGLILGGPVGVGKTYLMVAIAKRLIERGLEVKFVDFHRLLSVIRQAYADRKSEEEILAPLVEAQVLIIDELGKGRNNDWEQEKLDQIVMGRYNQNKPIIASTNYALKPSYNQQNIYNIALDQDPYRERQSNFNPDVFEPLETRVGKRIYSRLFESSQFLELQGDDYRRIRGS